MNVLLVINKLDVGGAERFVVQLATELTRRGHKVVVASDGGSLAKQLAPPIDWVRAAAHDRTPSGVIALARVLRGLVSSHSIDVIHANSPTTALAGRLACLGKPIPVVSSAHGVWRDQVKPGVSLLFSLGSDRVVGCSEALISDLVRHGLTRRKATTIHNGVPCSSVPPAPGVRGEVRAEFGLAPDRPVIITAARLADQKGLGYLIGAMPGVLGAIPGTVALFAGDGERRSDLERQAEALGLVDAVRFLGNRTDLDRLLHAADVFCLPSLQEGLPLAIAEAMVAGLPVVATPVGGVPEIVVDGVTGWLVPPCESQALASKLVSLLGDRQLRVEMGLLGRKRALEHFSLELMASRFERLYQEQTAFRPVPALTGR